MSRRDAAVTPISDDRALLGECPVWCEHRRLLYWIDIDGRKIHRTDIETGRSETRSLGVRPGSIALRSHADELIVAAEHDLWLLDWAVDALTRVATIEPRGAATRLNDGRCDPVGRFWVGSMDDPSDAAVQQGRLHLINTDFSVSTVADGIGVSNSLAFSPDGSTMYWSDTRTGTVWAHDYDADTGARTNGRVAVDFEGLLPGAPDGACVDTDGCLWIACVYGWGLARVTPDGDVDRFVELPVEKPSMPAFGGERLDTLFVTSISTGGSRPASPGQPLAGAVLALDVGRVGLPEPRFAG